MDNTKSDTEMANVPTRGLKKSSKFNKGAVHENGTGKFEILDRYIEDNIIMLKYKWLSGDLEGDIETNKEVNVNASIWKFKKVRGLIGNQQAEPSGMQMHEIQDSMQGAREFQEERLSEYMAYMTDIHKNTTELITVFHTYVEQGKSTFNRIDALEKQVTLLLENQRIYQEQIATLIRQNDLASKLIEKI
ncbi:hypothetical protein [Mesobacillus harenae]|uniref:hypothetical protein n=1 Tax=Mesobacillus harenae TaxID=2213203 RepID=UPI001580BBCE|nr:hypothetical protein [Mesobacillus harenae]